MQALVICNHLSICVNELINTLRETVCHNSLSQQNGLALKFMFEFM